MFSIPGNPPIATSRRPPQRPVADVGQGSACCRFALVTFQYKAKVPASSQWQAGVQRRCRGRSAIDVSYVGNQATTVSGAPGRLTVNLNAVDFGAAYLPANQDPTSRPRTVPGAERLDTNLLKPYRGLANINQNTTEFHDTYHSIQGHQPPLPERLLVRRQLHLGISFTGNTGLQGACSTSGRQLPAPFGSG